ncbi:hypothetical protein [Azospirillum sp. BE72]|uniref:hypothetical protein n=1 Tax=Azospirillum sp. BE72 TaxID=2817776 RepID=UPI0028672827|nr:hypothetical protein [Azospirillum sp. BE72]MDR6769847.1 hypothetical protein [Azospirillum sp. BE72]
MNKAIQAILIASLAAVSGCSTNEGARLINADIVQALQLPRNEGNGFAVEMISADNSKDKDKIIAELYRYSDFYKRKDSGVTQRDERKPFSVQTIQVPEQLLQQQPGSSIVFDIKVSSDIPPGKYLFLIRTESDSWRTGPFLISQQDATQKTVTIKKNKT